MIFSLEKRQSASVDISSAIGPSISTRPLFIVNVVFDPDGLMRKQQILILLNIRVALRPPYEHQDDNFEFGKGDSE